MATFPDERITTAPSRPGVGQELLRRLCTKNPFYVLSAALFLFGLRASIESQQGEVESWALLSGLAGYTLLLASAAHLLVRFGNVWDDVRTVLLLVVLMFLATSVTFDEALVLDPFRGRLFYLAGLAFAVLLSEVILRGIGLNLPVCYRLPYYLTLLLFFLYPVALSPMVHAPRSPGMLWGLYGFSLAAGLVFLTLLPAIRQGARVVANNGSPWPWPYFPWALFVILGVAVPGRAFLLCWSLHLLDMRDREGLIFGPHFLVPFGLALVVLLLEAGIVSGRRQVQSLALAAPLGLLLLCLVGHRPEASYRAFLDRFATTLGGDPFFLTFLAMVAFHAYAAGRRVRGALECLTASLLALAVVGPRTGTTGNLVGPHPLPILAAGLLQLGLGIWYRSSGRCLIGATGTVLGLVLALPDMGDRLLVRAFVFHLVVGLLLLIGALFQDRLARVLRSAGSVLLVALCLALLLGTVPVPPGIPAWMLPVHAFLAALVLVGYGLGVRDRLPLTLAVLELGCWLLFGGWQGYSHLRRLIQGLDYLILSLLFFGVAFLVSLAKAGHLSRWLSKPPPPELVTVAGGPAPADVEQG